MSNEINPYQSPLSAAPPAPRNPGDFLGRRRVVPFQSAHGLAIFSMVTIGMVCLASGTLLVAAYMQIELFDKASHGLSITRAEAFASIGRLWVAYVFRLAMFIVSGIVFLLWFYRVYRNLPALGALATEHSPGWAVGWWFIPFASLIVPYQISKEIWKGSHPENLGVLVKAQLARSTLVGAWWAFWLIMALIPVCSMFVMPGANSPDQAITASWTAIASMLATFPAGVLAILFVHGVDSNQRKRQDLCLQRLAAAGQSDFDDSPPGQRPAASADGEQFAPPASPPTAASGEGGEGIDNWLNNL